MNQRTMFIPVVPLMTLILAMALAVGAALFMTTRSAHAEISGPCAATIAGTDVAGVDSGNRDDDIHVSQDESVAVGATSTQGFQSHKIELEFASQRWTVSEEDDDGSLAWGGTVDVDDYATWGVGLYKVIGVSTLVDGTTCEGAATVDVDGNPLATVAGAAAAGGAVLGTVGGLVSATIAATGKPGPLSEFGPVGDMIGEEWQTQEASAEQAEPEKDGLQPIRDIHQDVIKEAESEEGRPTEEAQRVLSQVELFRSVIGCWCMAALALIMTPLMSLTGGGASGESGGPAEPKQPAASDAPERRRLPRAPWLPRITLLGLLSGLLAGAGGVVLLQQYSIEYPTLAVVIRTVVVAMVVYGIVLPTLGYTVGWLRINRRVAAKERELGWK